MSYLGSHFEERASLNYCHAGVGVAQQALHCDSHPCCLGGNRYRQVRDAWSCLGYCSNRILRLETSDGVQELQVKAGTIVFLSARCRHSSHPSGGDDKPLLFMYLDRSYRLPGDHGLKFDSCDALPKHHKYILSINHLSHLNQIYPEMLNRFSLDRPDAAAIALAEDRLQEVTMMEYFSTTTQPAIRDI
jgi:hypothetical protein